MFKIFVNFAMKSRNVLMNCKRKKFDRKDLPYHNYIKFDEYHNLLMENLGLKWHATAKILYHQQSVFGIPQDHLVKQCQLCQKLQVDISTLFKNAELLGWPSNTLRHRVLLLREMGVPRMDASIVSCFQILQCMTMRLFKAYIGIPRTVNVADNLLQCLHKPPPSVPPLEVLCENLTVNDYYKRCLGWYIQWRLNVSKEDVETVDRIVQQTKHKSFGLMRKLFDTLHYDIGLTIEQIKKDACLSVGSPEDLRKIIDKIQSFGGVDLRKSIKRHPEMHVMEYENVVAVIKLLKEHGFPEESFRRCPKILMMNSKVIASRLEMLEASPELRVLKNNVNALLLIHRFGKTHVRLEYLRYLNIKYTTVRTLTSDLRYFERFLNTGADYTRAKEIGYSLKKPLKLGIKQICQRIQKHPFWRHIDLVAMHDTLEFLLEHFTPEDLHDNLQLLLYPREKVTETLESLPEMNQNPDKKKYYSPKHILAICLYEMEREHHFSGDGVWRYDPPPPTPHKSSTKPIESELSDFSDSEIVESEEKEESSKDVNKIKQDKLH